MKSLTCFFVIFALLVSQSLAWYTKSPPQPSQAPPPPSQAPPPPSQAPPQPPPVPVPQPPPRCTCRNGLTIGLDIDISVSLCDRFEHSDQVIKGFVLSKAPLPDGFINVAVFVTACLKGTIQVGSVINIKVNATGCGIGIGLDIDLLLNIGYLLGVDVDVDGFISLSPCGLFIRLDDLTVIDIDALNILCGVFSHENDCNGQKCNGLEVCIPGVVDICACPNINICLPNLLAPVCGTDGKTYDNLCLLNIASCNAVKGGGIKIDLLAPIACNAGLLGGLTRCLGDVLGGLGLKK